MTLELPGSKARQVTAMFAMKSLRGDHEAPAFVDFQTPPATPAAYIVLGVTGSTISARVRPPTLPGPSDCHVPSTPEVEPASAAGVESPLALAREASRSASPSPVSDSEGSVSPVAVE